MTTVSCPACAKPNPADARFCDACGKKLPEALDPGAPRSIGSLTTDDREPVSANAGSVGKEATDGRDDPTRQPRPEPSVQPGTPKLKATPRRPDPEPDVPPARPTGKAPGPKAKGKSAKMERPPIQRSTYEQLCKNLPGRPYLAVLGTGEPSQGYALRHPLATLGRGPENQITVQDDRVSRAHAVLAPIGRDFVVIDLSSRHGTLVNGRRTTQERLRLGDVLDFGDTRMVFAVVPGADVPWGYELCPFWSPGAKVPNGCGTRAERETPISGEIAVTGEVDHTADPLARIAVHDIGSERRAASYDRPILIGRHEVCHLRPEADDVAMFHAQVYWAEDGVRVRDLGTTAGTFVNRVPVDETALTADGSISVGSAQLELSCYGDIPAHARTLARGDRGRHLALTCISGVVQGASATLPTEAEGLLLGRSRECDLYVEDPRVSSKHVSLNVTADGIHVEDLGSRNAFRAHGKKVRSATLKPGDTMTIGKSEFLVHYGL